MGQRPASSVPSSSAIRRQNDSMPARRHFFTLLAVCGLFLITFRWSTSPAALFGRHNRVILPDLRTQRPVPEPWRDIFPPGKTKEPGSDYTRTIVMAMTRGDNSSWVDEELVDILEPNGPFTKAVYVADDKTAPLHPVKNKGHEAMVYLSYIIEHYKKLPDVAIFVHAHRWTWHNNELMENDLAAMIRYLSPEKVTRDGYMNLRCHHDPGCPDWIHPNNVQGDNIQKAEELAISQHWNELFPNEKIPAVLSQACCAQFALSKERIRAIPLHRYQHLRAWLMKTDLDDYASGRVFEYIWQYIFTGNGVVCPEMHICYCDGYGLCFGGPKEFDDWFELRYKKNKLEHRIRRLKGEAQPKDEDGYDASAYTEVDEHVKADLKTLKEELKQMKSTLRKLKDEAFIRGGAGKARAKEAGRIWSPGDGY